MTYPADMFKTVKWHDGSPLSLGDFIFYMITNFDVGKPESPLFDEASQSTVDAFLQHFKGVRIVSTDPLVIETYDDRLDLDAENLVGNYYTSNWFPATNTGPQLAVPAGRGLSSLPSAWPGDTLAPQPPAAVIGQ